MKDAILIVTNSGERTVEKVLDHLRAMGESFFRFDTEKFPADYSATLTMDKDRLSGIFSLCGKDATIQSFDVRTIKSVWWRRPVGSMFSVNHPNGYAEFIREESGATLWSLYTTLSDVFWMNHPLTSVRLLEHNKLYQPCVASRLGLKTPRTIITNNPEEVLSFVRHENDVAAVKLIKGNAFTKEGSSVPLFAFTRQISEIAVREHWEDFRLAPVMVQEYVRKEIELRVTIVGGKVFACAIHSQDSQETKHDWRRYDFENVRHEIHQLPKEIEEKLLALLRYWGLTYGAIDLVLTPDGQYVFLEINPNGQWQWIETLTEMPISQAIAETLAAPPTDLIKVAWLP